MPEHVDLIVGYTCNNRCIHCFMEQTRISLKEKKHLFDKTTAQLKDSIKRYAEQEYKTITFTGGEPTIRPDFPELAKFVKIQGMSVSVQSNGRTFADKGFAKEIMEIEPDLSVTIPIHSHMEEIHDKITRVSGSFKQTISGIKNLVESGCKNACVKTVVHRLNYREVEDIVVLAKKIGAKQLNIAAPQMSGNPFIDWKKMAVPHTEVTPYIKKAIDNGVDSGVTVKYDAIPFCFMDGYEKYSSDIKTSIIPHINGDISIRESETKESVIFDLEVGRRAKPKICKSCKYFNVCMGVWKEYPEIIGVSEFKPITGRQIVSAKEFVEDIGVID